MPKGASTSSHLLLNDLPKDVSQERGPCVEVRGECLVPSEAEYSIRIEAMEQSDLVVSHWALYRNNIQKKERIFQGQRLLRASSSGVARRASCVEQRRPPKMARELLCCRTRILASEVRTAVPSEVRMSILRTTNCNCLCWRPQHSENALQIVQAAIRHQRLRSRRGAMVGHWVGVVVRQEAYVEYAC